MRKREGRVTEKERQGRQPGFCSTGKATRRGYLHGAAENHIRHFGVDLEVADAAVAVAGDGLNEGSLSRTRYVVEELGPPIWDSVRFVEGAHVFAHEVLEVGNHLRLGILGQDDGRQ